MDKSKLFNYKILDIINWMDKNMGKGVIGLFPHSTNDTHHPIYLSEADAIFIAGIFKKVMPVKYVSL